MRNNYMFEIIDAHIILEITSIQLQHDVTWSRNRDKLYIL